ncbi:MAG: hypothetical protein HOQ45_09525, partial [Nocardioidaceae bacterium]|nr:hypothetical protein [Nocardioidaceae bacterium]
MDSYLPVAEDAWRWVLAQVRYDDAGPWIPQHPGVTEPDAYRDGMYAGIGGLAHALAEVRATRGWTGPEQSLADAVAERLVAPVAEQTTYDFFDGLGSTIGALLALGAPGSEAAVARLLALAEDDGWPQGYVGPPSSLPGTRLNDATLGTASVLLSAVWAHRNGVPGASELAAHAAGVLLAEAEQRETGPHWPFVPARFRTRPEVQMPNWSHGQAGV